MTYDKSDGKLSKYVYGGWRYSSAPALNIADGSLTITNGDDLRFAHKKDCLTYDARLYRRYNKWMEDTLLPEHTDNLSDGTHYYLCYYVASMNITFPFAQIYNAYIVDKISPVELSSFRTHGVTESWLFEGGDQAYGDTIMFATNCNSPTTGNLIISRTVSGT